jgi:hypothetical protein
LSGSSSPPDGFAPSSSPRRHPSTRSCDEPTNSATRTAAGRPRDCVRRRRLLRLAASVLGVGGPCSGVVTWPADPWDALHRLATQVSGACGARG